MKLWSLTNEAAGLVGRGKWREPSKVYDAVAHSMILSTAEVGEQR